jgi:hypothetical protein
VHHDHVVEHPRDRLRPQPRALRRILAASLAQPVQIVVAEHRFGAELHQQRQRARRVRALVDEVPDRQQPIDTRPEPDRREQPFERLAATLHVTDEDASAHGITVTATGALHVLMP